MPAENPVLAVDWNPERRRDTGMGVADLTDWWRELQALDNPPFENVGGYAFEA